MNRYLLALSLCSLATATHAQRCAPSTPLARQYRTAMKHRAPGASGVAVRLEAMRAWPPPADLADAGRRAQDTAIDPRESQAFTVEGDLWRLKVEDNDCDLHLELSAPGAGANAPRIIAEIPTGAGYDGARAAALAAVHLPSGRAGDRLDLATPVRVRLTGYAFWDGAHWCRRDGARGCGHGTPFVDTLWELHPVWRFESVSGGASSSPTGPRPTAPPSSAGRVVCLDGWVSPCACGHPPHMHCCRGHRGESRSCGGSASSE